MLVLDSDKRITAAQALAHAYFAQYHDPDDEPVADPYDQSFESRDLLIDEWKSKSEHDEHVALKIFARWTTNQKLSVGEGRGVGGGGADSWLNPTC